MSDYRLLVQVFKHTSAALKILSPLVPSRLFFLIRIVCLKSLVRMISSEVKRASYTRVAHAPDACINVGGSLKVMHLHHE